MIKREISLDCGARALMQARDALGSLGGVVAAEVVAGRSAIRIWQDDALSEQSIRAAVAKSGVSRFSIR